MFSNTIRIILLVIGAGVAVFCAMTGLLFQMGFIILFMALIVLGYFKNGTVFLALRRMGKNDFSGAEDAIRMTRYPKYLASLQKGYYYLVTGLIEARKSNFILAANNLEQALATGLRTDNDKTIAMLNLASIYYHTSQREKAKEYIAKAKELNKNPSLEGEINKLDEALKY